MDLFFTSKQKNNNSTPQSQSIQPEELSLPIQCETNPIGVNGVVVCDDQTFPLTSVQSIQPEELSLPIQCETNPTGVNGVVVCDDETFPLTSVQCEINPSGLNGVGVYDDQTCPLTPVQCENSPTDLNEVVVHNDQTCPITSDGNHESRGPISSADSSAGVGGRLAHQQSLGEIHHQGENPGLTTGGRSYMPVYETTQGVNDPRTNRVIEDGGQHLSAQSMQSLANWIAEAVEQIPLPKAVGSLVAEAVGSCMTGALTGYLPEILCDLVVKALKSLVTYSVQTLVAFRWYRSHGRSRYWHTSLERPLGAVSVNV
uniref:uncharacterized protein LOC124069468 n=1 Tax=Scatophagus argus TaxID=75038 RepID=UPI001ED833E5|nr:uncharacterized protein LOC124069468 [Scatophagus argus]